MNEKVSSWHIEVSAKAFGADQFSRYGIDVYGQYGENQEQFYGCHQSEQV